MMIDPSKMSGIPRPDPQVPPGTITVRLIRGELSNRVVGLDVALADESGKIVKQKTDAEGRATFSGLAAPGPYHGPRQGRRRRAHLAADSIPRRSRACA